MKPRRVVVIIELTSVRYFGEIKATYAPPQSSCYPHDYIYKVTVKRVKK